MDDPEIANLRHRLWRIDCGYMMRKSPGHDRYSLYQAMHDGRRSIPSETNYSPPLTREEVRAFVEQEEALDRKYGKGHGPNGGLQEFLEKKGRR